MKPSHRKDVIIARVIFAFICIALIAIIVSVIILISSHTKKKQEPKGSGEAALTFNRSLRATTGAAERRLQKKTHLTAYLRWIKTG